jgi:hypothetical protein
MDNPRLTEIKDNTQIPYGRIYSKLHVEYLKWHDHPGKGRFLNR